MTLVGLRPSLVLLYPALVFVASCVPSGSQGDRPGEAVDGRAIDRSRMVSEQIAARGVRDPAVLEAVRTVPRHLFVPQDLSVVAYTDAPLPIGHEQTISQPYIVALMTELMGLTGGETVLEVGTGSGYQAAVLSEIAGSVFSIEIIEELATSAAERLSRLGYANVTVKHGDGYRGWPEHAPFDAIVVTAAPDHIPEPLLAQLGVGGRLVIPVGDYYQELIQVTRTNDGFARRSVVPVRFVPMTGEAEEEASSRRGP